MGSKILFFFFKICLYWKGGITERRKDRKKARYYVLLFGSLFPSRSAMTVSPRPGSLTRDVWLRGAPVSPTPEQLASSPALFAKVLQACAAGRNSCTGWSPAGGLVGFSWHLYFRVHKSLVESLKLPLSVSVLLKPRSGNSGFVELEGRRTPHLCFAVDATRCPLCAVRIRGCLTRSSEVCRVYESGFV